MPGERFIITPKYIYPLFNCDKGADIQLSKEIILGGAESGANEVVHSRVWGRYQQIIGWKTSARQLLVLLSLRDPPFRG